MSKSLYAISNREALSASRYRVIAQLGRGGMASVFLAIQSGIAGFRRLSVVKRLRSDFNEADFIDMFQAEARLAVRLNHPNVVHTYEVGHDGECHFISMEFLEGQSYDRLLKRVGRDKLDLAYSVRILIEALRGLEYAHQLKDFDGTPLNIVHRDASPSNVFITYDGQIKILDFGIAKAMGTTEDTEAGVIKGKLAYMAPEQVSGTGVGPQADLYAIGVLLWEAVAQRRRWEGLTNPEILKKLVANEPPTSPEGARRGLPFEVDALCLQALAPEPGNRFVSAEEFRLELEGLLEKLGKNVGADEVGRLLSEEFKEEREKLRATIEEKMKEGDAGGDLTLDALSSLKEAGKDAEGDESGIATIVPDDKPPERTAKPPYAVVGLGLGAAGLLGAFGFFAAQGEPARAPSPTELRVVVPGKVSIRVSATPENAKLFWNDAPLTANPHVIELTRSPATVRLRAEAEGFVTERAIVSLDAARDVRFTLKALPNPTTSAGGNAPTAGSTQETSSNPAPRPARRSSKKGRLELDTSDPWK